VTERNFAETDGFMAEVNARGTDDDAALMASFVESRDRRIFQVLYQRYRAPIVAYAGRYTRDRARAEEIAQEVFVRVYTAKSYQADASFKSWLYTVATNVCLNEVRRPEHRQRFESLDAPRDEGKGPVLAAREDASPEAQMAHQQVAARLEATLAALPEKQRAAFLMVRHEAMTHEEIAKSLKTSVSAVKSLVHRALETLRKELRTIADEMADESGSAPRAEEART